MKFAWVIMIALLPSPLFGQQLERTHRIGTAIPDRESGWSGHVLYASWIDEETIVFWRKSGELICWDLTDSKTLWSLKDIHHLSGWSVSIQKRRLALLCRPNLNGMSNTQVRIIDCEDGSTLFDSDEHKLAKLLETDVVVPDQIALTPKDAKLILHNLATKNCRNGYVIGHEYKNLEQTFRIDVDPNKIDVSSDGSRVILLGDKGVICIHDIQKNEEIYFQGKLIRESQNQNWSKVSIDAPFLSHARHDGVDTLIYSIDNCWSTGSVFVRNLKTEQVSSFDARNGHVEMDVDFDRKRIALTGCSAGLTLLKFDGKVLAHIPKASLQRNCCIAFSPSGNQVLIGSMDNSVSIFAIGE